MCRTVRVEIEGMTNIRVVWAVQLLPWYFNEQELLLYRMMLKQFENRRRRRLSGLGVASFRSSVILS